MVFFWLMVDCVRLNVFIRKKLGKNVVNWWSIFVWWRVILYWVVRNLGCLRVVSSMVSFRVLVVSFMGISGLGFFGMLSLFCWVKPMVICKSVVDRVDNFRLFRVLF